METYRILYLAVALSVMLLVDCMNWGDINVRPKSPPRRFIFDANNGFTGWASWEQYAACSTRCVSGYEKETKQCCETGDNRLCFNLPWDILKPYVGSCQNTTSIATTLTTRKRQTTIEISTTPSTTPFTTPSTTPPTMPSTTPSTTPQPSYPPTTYSKTAYRTTVPPPRTLPPVPMKCAVCAGPDFICEQLYTTKVCEPPNNYCINKITNYKDGTRSVVRSCGSFDTCYRDWWLGTSDEDNCRKYDENNIITLDFQCTFCCIEDGCNIPLRPAGNTLYRDF